MAEQSRAPVSELERAEIPWVVAYLREDIQDLRSEVREVRRLTIESYEKLDAKIEGLRQDMDTKIEALDTKIDARTDGLDAKIDTRTRELRQEIGDLRRVMNVQFRWLVTTMVAVGVLVVAILEFLR